MGSVPLSSLSSFAEKANESLSKAVGELNAELGDEPRAFFADPKFGPHNGVFGSDPWLWGARRRWA